MAPAVSSGLFSELPVQPTIVSKVPLLVSALITTGGWPCCGPACLGSLSPTPQSLCSLQVPRPRPICLLAGDLGWADWLCSLCFLSATLLLSPISTSFPSTLTFTSSSPCCLQGFSLACLPTAVNHSLYSSSDEKEANLEPQTPTQRPVLVHSLLSKPEEPTFNLAMAM